MALARDLGGSRIIRDAFRRVSPRAQGNRDKERRWQSGSQEARKARHVLRRRPRPERDMAA